MSIGPCLHLLRESQNVNRAATALLVYTATSRGIVVEIYWHGVALYRPHYGVVQNTKILYTCYGILPLGPGLLGMPENRPQLPFFNQACLSYSFRACRVRLSHASGTPEA